MSTNTTNERPALTGQQIRQLCHAAMNKGMTLRQNQLAGYGGDKSGREILDDWLDVVFRRLAAGLDPLA